MNEERFWLLVSLKFSGEAQPEELVELETLLQQHPEMGLRTEMLDTIWRSPGKPLLENSEARFNKHLQRLSNHFSEPVLQYEITEIAEEKEYSEKPRPVIRKKLFWLAGIAASFLIVWFIVFYVPGKNSQGKASAQNTVSTKRGSKSKIQLPDGTQVWLNADSKITYNENFQGTLREVQLAGEAFFDVVRDETRPFIIHTNAIDLKVLGTAFNVRSYPEEKNTETSLIRGSVEITLRNNPDKKIILKPNEKLIVNNIEATMKPKINEPRASLPLMTLAKVSYKAEDSSAAETLWVKNKLAFDGEALEDIALKIERWYDVKVIIKDETLKKEPYTASFEDKTLQEVMEALQLSGNFKYAINKKEVTIRR
jgi:transmembrane sensor